MCWPPVVNFVLLFPLNFTQSIEAKLFDFFEAAIGDLYPYERDRSISKLK